MLNLHTLYLQEIKITYTFFGSNTVFFSKNNGLKGKVRMISSGPVSALGPAFITCLLYKTTLPSYSKMILFITLHPEKAFIAFRNHQFIFGIEI